MLRLIKPILWSFLFLISLLLIDQFFLHVSAIHPSHTTARKFYLDFRHRLSTLVGLEESPPLKSIEALIEKQHAPKGSRGQKSGTLPLRQNKSSGTPPAHSSPQYIYSDEKGDLHFVDSLEEVPEKFRTQAQAIGQ